MAITKSLSAQRNPLLEDWRTPFGVPSFEQIKADHFLPAFREAIARRKQEIAVIALRFAENVLQEMNRYRLVVERRDDLAGLPDQAVTAAAETAEQAGMKGKWVFTLHHPSLWPFLKNADNRELRRKIFTAYTTLGNHDNAADNKATLARIAALRAEKARPLGYGTWADYLLEEHMAKTPASVYGFLDRLWPAARQMAEREAGVLQAAIRADGGRLYSSRTIGSTTRKRCAGAISISTSPLCVPTSRSTRCARARSGWPTGSTASPSPSSRTCPCTTPR
jgi:Zn-dependent oligopeptidase